MAFLKNDELNCLGLESLGENVKISDKATIINAGKISIGNDVRIDDFCIISAGEGGIKIGNFVHIAPYVSIQGHGKVVLDDFSGLSSKVTIYSSSDDYSGRYLTNPTVPEKFTNVLHGDVILKKHVIIGTGSVLLPNCYLEEGVAVGAMSLVRGRVNEWVTVSGIPAKKIKNRSKRLLEMEKELLEYKYNE